MATQIFVNLPVADLNRSVEFFTKLGYTFNPQFTNDDATCMIVGDNIFVMLLVRKFYQTFTEKEIVDAFKANECINCLGLESRAAVDDLVNKAVAAGGRATKQQDHGFMYSWGYEDLDGHLWEVVWMAPQPTDN